MLPYLDRLVTSQDDSVSVAYVGGSTVYTLPYSANLDGSEGDLIVVSGDSQSGYPEGSIIPSTRTAPDNIAVVGPNLVGFLVYIGVAYAFEIQLTRLYPRRDVTNGPPIADTRGVLQVQRIKFSKEGPLTGIVQAEERPATEYPSGADEEFLRVPVLSNNERVTIRLTNGTPSGNRLYSAAWEGFHHNRNIAR